MTAAEKKGFRWGLERRLAFIEFRLFWEGGINRADLVAEFGVSIPQASKDLALYQQEAPINIRYDRSQKRYFAAGSFRPKFIQLNAGEYLERLAHGSRANDRIDSLSTEVLAADILPIPQRRIRAEVLRSVLACARANTSIEILYQSMSRARPDPLWRRISPHAFGSDGFRWHVRSYCHIDNKFKDFILSRCLEARAPGPLGVAASEDEFWNAKFLVLLAPNPRLTSGQQEIIAEDYGMENGCAAVPVRQALLYYFSKRLRLDAAASLDDAREAPVIVRNREAFDAALSEAMR